MCQHHRRPVVQDDRCARRKEFAGGVAQGLGTKQLVLQIHHDQSSPLKSSRKLKGKSRFQPSACRHVVAGTQLTCWSYLQINAMRPPNHDETDQVQHPSPVSHMVTAVDVLRFKKLKGFSLHKRKAPDDVSNRRHTKIRSNTQGKLSLSQKTFKVKKNSNQSPRVQASPDIFLHDVDIPEPASKTIKSFGG
ncbi:hypothetical protein BDN67DRAFT_985701 [Paxillus ammoniavirescens]|nr:hypothetical protein BDN67DRAFT_985701 [Paxillus ammoniavirescens]